jgi:hypothetical protein
VPVSRVNIGEPSGATPNWVFADGPRARVRPFFAKTSANSFLRPKTSGSYYYSVAMKCERKSALVNMARSAILAARTSQH